MTSTIRRDARGNAGWWRPAMWIGAAALLAAPAVAMRFTREVAWTAADFGFAAVLLFGACALVEVALRARADPAYRAGVLLAVAAAFVTLWADAAVGIIGAEDNGYNLLFPAVVAAAIVGAALVRLAPAGLAVVAVSAAAAQAVLALGGIGSDPRGGLFALALALAWLVAGLLFRTAARRAAARG